MLPSKLNAVVGLVIKQAPQYEFQLLTTYIQHFHLLRFWYICMFYLLLEGWPNISGNLVFSLSVYVIKLWVNVSRLTVKFFYLLASDLLEAVVCWFIGVKFLQIISRHLNFLFSCRSSQATLTPVTWLNMIWIVQLPHILFALSRWNGTTNHACV